jgi:long-chain acyl-CoA synthetase
VGQVAVVGVADARKGQVVAAFVVPKPGFELFTDELLAWSRENMSAYKVPRMIQIREQLPMTASGKVKRNQLQLVPV